MSISNIVTKRIAISALALSSILGVACTQATGAAPGNAAEKTGQSKAALRDPGCILPGYTDVSGHDNCYNQTDGVHDAAPNTDKNSPGYCPDQAVYELDPDRWRPGFNVIPKIWIDPSSIEQLDSQYNCENLIAHVSIMTTYDPAGTTNRLYSSRGEYTETYRWIGSSATSGQCVSKGWDSNPTIDPYFYAGVRVTGEIYWNVKNKGESFSVPSRVRLVADNHDNCIF